MFPSESPSERIARVAELLASMAASSDDQQRTSAYYEASGLIDELLELAALEPVFGDTDKSRRRLMDLRCDLSSVAGISKPDFFSVEEHHLNALGAIVGLELQLRQARAAAAWT